MNRLLLYIHVFRSGGSTFCRIMFQVGKGRFARGHTKAFLDNPGSAHRKLDMIAGHFAWGAHHFVSRPCEYVTILREPVDRILALQFQQPEDTPERVLARLRQGQFRTRSPNMAVRLITSHSADEIRAGYDKKKLGVAELESAKANLRQMAFVGIFDELEQSIRQIQALANVPQEGWCHANASPYRPKDLVVPDDVQQLIRERDWMDVELYELAKELYRSKMRS